MLAYKNSRRFKLKEKKTVRTWDFLMRKLQLPQAPRNQFSAVGCTKAKKV